MTYHNYAFIKIYLPLRQIWIASFWTVWAILVLLTCSPRKLGLNRVTPPKWAAVTRIPRGYANALDKWLMPPFPTHLGEQLLLARDMRGGLETCFNNSIDVGILLVTVVGVAGQNVFG